MTRQDLTELHESLRYHLLNDWRFDVAYERHVEGCSTLAAVVSIAIARARQVGASLVCAVRGHDLEDEGYANPESGCIDMVCQRCGYSYGRVVLY